MLTAEDRFDGDTLCHGDLRPDNLLVEGGSATVLDCNWVGTAATWVDWVGLLPLMAAQGVDTDALVASSPLTRGVDPEAIDAYLASIAMAHAFLEMLRHGRGWEKPPTLRRATRLGRVAERLSDRLRQAWGRVLGGGGRTTAPAPKGRPDPSRHDGGVPAPGRARDYPGDYPGVPAISYAPKPDGQPDPGEIVWTWVPFEEDHSLGKDRPVLLVGSDGDWLLGVMLTSKDHDHDSATQRAQRRWVDIGSGGWDSSGRASEVRVDRIIRVDPDAIRREGSVLGEDHFDEVAQAIRETS